MGHGEPLGVAPRVKLLLGLPLLVGVPLGDAPRKRLLLGLPLADARRGDAEAEEGPSLGVALTTSGVAEPVREPVALVDGLALAVRMAVKVALMSKRALLALLVLLPEGVRDGNAPVDSDVVGRADDEPVTGASGEGSGADVATLVLPADADAPVDAYNAPDVAPAVTVPKSGV
jgi:hypothetical protein